MTSSLYGLLPDEIDAVVSDLGLPAYRSAQLLHGLYRDRIESVDELRTWPAEARRSLVAHGYDVVTAEVVASVASDDGETTKGLLRFDDGALIETVLMQYPEAGRHPRSTVCVSTQAGCAMGCVFCATGQMGFERNLTAAHIVAQVVHFARLLAHRAQHVTNVVFMGMGEPLANYEQTVRAVRILTDPRALGLGQRNITISTVGVIRGIRRLAAEGLNVGLAISLHAPNDELRRRLVPTAAPNSVSDLVGAARDYFKAIGRRVSFEYALVAGVNDSPELAAELARLLRHSGAHVNLIPVNPTAGGFRRPSRARVLGFEAVLRAKGINCTVRVEKGSEIAAACGQLRTDAEARRPLSASRTE